MRIAQSSQKSYANHRLRGSAFEVEDFVYLMVLRMRGLRRFKLRGKLAPRFISPFKITKERKEELKVEFPNFFSDPSESRG
jgi:hypothetical protein